SFEMPAFSTYRLGSLAASDWTTAPPVGSTSYQLIWLPAPPRTVWPAHRVVVPKVGSTPDTACVRRPSRVSSVLAVPFWGAFGGLWKEPTTIESGEDTAGTPPLFVTVNTVSCVPVPHLGGHSMSDRPSTYPVADGSVWIAGTGGKAGDPSACSRPAAVPRGNEPA